MSIEQSLERIADCLEILAGKKLPGGEAVDGPVVAPKKTKRMKDAAIPAQQAAAVVEDTIPGMEDAPDVLASESNVRTGAELRNLAQALIAAADKSDPGGKNGTVNKLVTFIQSVAKIFNAAEPKLIKIPDAKVAEAAAMIEDWCGKNGIKV